MARSGLPVNPNGREGGWVNTSVRFTAKYGAKEAKKGRMARL